ncbi:MAG TPA: hypothetical protein VEI95_04070 [Acidobacteriota bacterium]|nr:hypothetical protein [Acidobacteriota bacterium]
MASKKRSPIIDFAAVPLFIVLGLVGLLVGSRWFLNPANMTTDGAIVSAIGFLCLLRVKFSRLRRGVGTPDPTETDIGSRDYKTALALVLFGAALVLFANLGFETVTP